MAKWVLMERASETARPQSIYGILDREQRRQLPKIEEGGEWQELHELEPKLVPDVERAQQAMARSGYYLIGGADRFV